MGHNARRKKRGGAGRKAAKDHAPAQFVPQEDPSLQEQYEYASDHEIKCLVFITEAGLSQTDLVKVRHLDAKRRKKLRERKL